MNTIQTIKPFRELDGSTVEYFSGDEVASLSVDSISGGGPKGNLWISIEGTGSAPPNAEQKKIMFGGTYYNAQIKVLGHIEDFCRLRLETMISDPAFWP